MSRDRHLWVDCARAIGMILVVYGHEARGLHGARLWPDGPVFDVVDSIVYGFHMPLFFFLSGLFFQRTLDTRGRTATIAGRVDTVLYPYVLWSLLQGSVEVGLSAFTNGDATWAGVLALAWRPRAQFWFLYALFALAVVGAFVFHRRHAAALWTAILATVAAYLATSANTEPPIVQSIGRHAVYFVLGVLIARPDRIARWLGHRAATPSLLALFVVVNAFLHFGIDWRYEDGGIAGLAAGTIGIAMVVAVSITMAKVLPVRGFAKIGEHSMSIYLLHILIIAGIRIVLSRVFGVTDLATHLIVSCTAGIAIPLAISVIVKRRGLYGIFELPPSFTMNRLRGLQSARSTPG